VINYEDKSIDKSKHRKNKSAFDSSLSFDIKSDIKPQIKTLFNHINYESRVFKNLELDKVSNNQPQKLSIKTFEQIRKLNPDIDFVKDKVDLKSLIKQGFFNYLKILYKS